MSDTRFRPELVMFGSTQIHSRMVSLTQISVGGLSGSGKSSITNTLAGMLPEYKTLSIGTLFRKKATELGMSIEAFTEYLRTHPEEGYDFGIDSHVYDQALTYNNLIIEGRLAHITTPYAFHVLLKCDVKIRAKRRFLSEQKKHNGNTNLTPEGVLQQITERDKADLERYEVMYPGCMWPEEHFDFVFDNEPDRSPTEIAEIIMSVHRMWVNKHLKEMQDFCFLQSEHHEHEE